MSLFVSMGIELMSVITVRCWLCWLLGDTEQHAGGPGQWYVAFTHLGLLDRGDESFLTGQ
jgi:hypothetical protein